MSYGQNLVHVTRTSLSRVGPYRFCSGGTLYKPSWGYRFGYRFRVGPYRFCSDGYPTTLSILLWSYLILSDTHMITWSSHKCWVGVTPNGLTFFSSHLHILLGSAFLNGFYEAFGIPQVNERRRSDEELTWANGLQHMCFFWNTTNTHGGDIFPMKRLGIRLSKLRY